MLGLLLLICVELAIVSTAAEVALATTSFLKDRNPNKSVKTDGR